jgi:hypothetical protein
MANRIGMANLQGRGQQHIGPLIALAAAHGVLQEEQPYGVQQPKFRYAKAR